MLRPCSSVSLSISTAFAALSTVSISTMPQPLLRPPGPSVRILVWITSPACRKWSFRSCQDTRQDRLCTYRRLVEISITSSQRRGAVAAARYGCEERPPPRVAEGP